MTLEKENVDEDILKVGQAPYEVEVDLMTPLNPDVPPKVRTIVRYVLACCIGLLKFHHHNQFTYASIFLILSYTTFLDLRI